MNSNIIQFFMRLAKALKQLNEDNLKSYQSVFYLTITSDNHVNMNKKMVSNSIFYDTRRKGHSVRTGVHRSNSFITTP